MFEGVPLMAGTLEAQGHVQPSPHTLPATLSTGLVGMMPGNTARFTAYLGAWRPGGTSGYIAEGGRGGRGHGGWEG